MFHEPKANGSSGLGFFVLLSPGFAFESAEHKPFSSFTYLAVTYGAQPV